MLHTLKKREFVARENSSSVFPFISWLDDQNLLSSSLSPKQIYYETIAKLTSIENEESQNAKILGWTSSPTLRSLLSFYISTRSGAPSVEAHYQFYLQTIIPSFVVNATAESPSNFDLDCPSWVDWNGIQYCSVHELEKAVESFDATRSR